MALGLQDKFSWRQLGASALTAGLTQYAGLNADLSKVNDTGAALNYVEKNLISQSVNLIVGKQHKFSWASLAASAASSVIDKQFNTGSFANKQGSELTFDHFGQNLASEFLKGAIQPHLTYDGQGRLGWALSAFGSALGDSLVGQFCAGR